ncbi:MAG: ATP synthase F1 subunit epsilon [Rhodospirillales bacterium]|jgi:F-type H+-transporting ATPase subunit epsilon|nr:ATP synthase F1 subunit epsilon [Rhodospirillales bacterium]
MAEETFLFEIITPTQAMLSQQAELVIIPGAAGNFGVLPHHSPLLSSLRPGTIEIRERGLKVLRQIFVEGGFCEVTPDRCTVLAEEALDVKEISRDVAEERLKRAHDSLMVAGAFNVRIAAERDVRAAEAMLAAIEQLEH